MYLTLARFEANNRKNFLLISSTLGFPRKRFGYRTLLENLPYLCQFHETICNNWNPKRCFIVRSVISFRSFRP